MQINPRYGMLQKLSQSSLNSEQVEEIGRAYAQTKINELLDPSQHPHATASQNYVDFARDLRHLQKADLTELERKITALYQSVVQFYQPPEQAMYLDCVRQVERILNHPDAPLSEPLQSCMFPCCDTIKALDNYDHFTRTLAKLKDPFKHQPVSVFISYEETAKPFQNMFREHLSSLGVEVNPELILNSNMNQHYQQVYKRDFVIVLGTPNYLKRVKETAMVQYREGLQPHRILRVLLSGEVTTSFPPLLNADGFVDMKREEQYFAAFFQLIDVLFAITFDQEPTLKKEIQLYQSHPSKHLSSLPTPSSLSVLRSQLIAKSREHWFLTRFLNKRKFPLASSFIQLMHVMKEEQKQKELDSSQMAADYLSRHEAIYKAKEPLLLKNLFSPQGDKTYHHVLVEGRAGIGKSTFCQYLFHMWSKLNQKERSERLGPWANAYQLVLWIPLHEISKIDTPYPLEHFVKWKCFPAKTDLNALKQTLDTGSVLYLLDGFDEVAHFKNEPSPRGKLLDEFLEQSDWLLTSRPNFFTHGNDADILHLENIGFSEANIENYVQTFFTDFDKPEKTEEFHQLIAHSPSIKAMAHIPINLELLCSHLLESAVSNEISLTEIYTNIKINLFRRFLKKDGKKCLLTDDLIEQLPLNAYLEHLAWEAMKKKSLHIGPSVYKALIGRYESNGEKQEVFFDSAMRELGFFKPVGRDKDADEIDYYFIHLTFQEYFAASYLARLIKQSPEEGLRWIRDNKFDRRYEVMLTFTAGLLATDQTAINRFFDTLIQEPKSFLGVHEYCLAGRCSEEIKHLEKWQQSEPFLLTFSHFLQSASYTSRRHERHLFPTLFSSPHLFASAPIKNHFLAQLTHPNITINFMALFALKTILPKDAAISEALVKLLDSQDGYIIQIIAEIFEKVPWTAKAPDTFIKILSDPLSDCDRRDSDGDVVGSILASFKKRNADRDKVITSLIPLLNDQNPRIRHRAVRSLTHMKLTEEEHVNTIVQLLKHPDPTFRTGPEEILREIESINSMVVTALKELLQSTDTDTRYRALKILFRITPFTEDLVETCRLLLTDKDRGMCCIAARKIATLTPPDPSAIETLITLLSYNDYVDKYETHCAMDTLCRICIRQPSLIQKICPLIKSNNVTIARNAAQILAVVKPTDPNILRQLVENLKEKECAYSSLSFSVLQTIRPHHPLVIPPLLSLLDACGAHDRAEVIKLLGDIKPDDPDVSLKLVKFLADADSTVRLETLLAFQAIKPTDSATLAALQELSCHSDLLGKFYATVILAKLNPTEENRQALSLFLGNATLLVDDNDAYVNCMVLETMMEESRRRPDFSRTINRLLERENSAIINRITSFLAQIKVHDDQIIKKLIALLSSDHHFIRDAAADALIGMKPTDHRYFQRILRMLSTENPPVKYPAIKVLYALNKYDNVFVTYLISILGDPEWQLSDKATKILKEIGSFSPEHCNQLIHSLLSPQREVRVNVIDLIESIMEKNPPLLIAFGSELSADKVNDFEVSQFLMPKLTPKFILAAYQAANAADKQHLVRLLRAHLETGDSLLFFQNGKLFVEDHGELHPFDLDTTELRSLAKEVYCPSSQSERIPSLQDMEREKTHLEKWQDQGLWCQGQLSDHLLSLEDGSQWTVVPALADKTTPLHALMGSKRGGIYQWEKGLRHFLAYKIAQHRDDLEIISLVRDRLQALKIEQDLPDLEDSKYFEWIDRTDFQLGSVELKMAARLYRISYFLFTQQKGTHFTCTDSYRIDKGCDPVVLIDHGGNRFSRCELKTTS